MSEIREYRGMRTDNGEWVYGAYVAYNWHSTTEDGDQEISGVVVEEANIISYADECLWVAVIPQTVGQAIGKNDKNGKKVFEGDIVKDFIPFNVTCNGQKLYKENTYIVEYDNEKCCFKPFCERDHHGEPIIEECVVIGNVYDNPELLGGK